MKEAAPRVAHDVAEDLIQLCAAGDRAAFAELYDFFSARAYGIALRVVRDPALAEDVAHDAWLNVWDCAAAFDPVRGSAAGWIMSLVHRRAVDTVRRIEAGRARERLDAQRTPPQTHPSGEDIAALNEARRTVRHCMEVISERQKEALSLAYFEGFTHSEIASTLGIETSAVKSRIRKALAGLRRCLGDE